MWIVSERRGYVNSEVLLGKISKNNFTFVFLFSHSKC